MNKIIFVGSFNLRNKPNIYGGQLTACREIIEYKEFQKYDFKKIDCVQWVPIKILDLLFRNLKFSWSLIRYPRVPVIIFSSHGTSFLEKSVMVYLAKLLSHKVIFFSRSGLLKENLDTSKLYRKKLKKLLERVTFFVAQSEYWHSYFSSLTGEFEDKYHTIHNWMDFAKLDDGVYKEECEKKEENSILFLGDLTYDKGLDQALEAIKHLSEVGIDACLKLVGKFPVKPHDLELIEECRKRDDINIVGPVSDKVEKKKLLKEAKILLFPSRAEGYPNAVVEGLFYGKIVVSSDTGALKDMIVDGENGYISPVGDQKALNKNLEKALQNDNQEIVASATASAKKNNDVRVQFDKLDKLIMKTLA